MRLSAFADEISPDPADHLAVLAACGVAAVEVRSVLGVNVLALSDAQVADYRARLAGGGFAVSAVASPVGKVSLDAPAGPHLDRLRRALDLCHTFGTRRVRVFSFYPPAAGFAGDWSPHRAEVLDRLWAMAELAAAAGVELVHENEHRIYGDSPDRVRDLFAAVDHPSLRAAHDAGNWVACGYDPVDGWAASAPVTTHYHVKDWKAGGTYGVLAGTGDGRLDLSVTALVAATYAGYAVLEPHLRGGGPTGGQTGPDLFPAAVAAFRALLAECGGSAAG